MSHTNRYAADDEYPDECPECGAVVIADEVSISTGIRSMAFDCGSAIIHNRHNCDPKGLASFSWEGCGT